MTLLLASKIAAAVALAGAAVLLIGGYQPRVSVWGIFGAIIRGGVAGLLLFFAAYIVFS